MPEHTRKTAKGLANSRMTTPSSNKQESVTEGTQTVVAALRRLLDSLPKLSPADWNIIDQAFDTAKSIYGVESDPLMVGNLIDDALMKEPEGFEGNRLAILVSLMNLDGMRESLEEEPELVRERLNRLASRYQVWAAHILRRATSSQLDWTFINGSRVTVGKNPGKVRLRLEINRRDSASVVLEMSAASTLKLARTILERAMTDIDDELAKLPSTDVARFKATVDELLGKLEDSSIPEPRRPKR